MTLLDWFLTPSRRLRGRVLRAASTVPVVRCVALGCTVGLSLGEVRRYQGFCGRHAALWALAGRKHYG